MPGLTCRDARNLFDAHLDGELSTALETELNAHRVGCPHCRHELALLEVAGQVIGAEDAAPGLDDGFADRLLACVEARPQSPWNGRRMIRIGLRGLAAAACVALVAGYFSRPAEQVAGHRFVAPGFAARNASGVSAEAPARVESPEARFQAQLERALTEWRKDASSLRRIYDFITPQIVQEMGLNPAEGAHDRTSRFEPANTDLPDASAPSESDVEIEDI